jgi:signal transduction histidine kinase
MNIKTRLAVQFTVIVAVILLFFSVLAYYFSYSGQISKFRETLLEKAKNTAILLIDVAEVDSSLLKKIHQSTMSYEDEEIAITDSAFNTIYSNNIQLLYSTVYQRNMTYGTRRYFSIGRKDGVCYRHTFGSRTYFTYVAAYDKSRNDNLRELRDILLWSNLFSIWLSVLFSYLFSLRAINPIKKIIKSVKEINSLKLGNRLNEGKGKDEIEQLAITFNEMLSNLELAFKNQEEFVLNASHELRTPITVLIGENDYLLSRERTQQEYVAHLRVMVDDLKRINILINSLLELAQINRDETVPFAHIRIDEIVYVAVHQIKTKYNGRRILPKIVYPENDSDLLVNGNEGLLTIAFSNLIDNACKFSDDDVIIEFKISADKIAIIISDKGIGIPVSEIDSIYKPFSRASNAKFIGGFGIGLALVNRIFELHEAKLLVESKQNEGTRFDITFNRIVI